ncbi:nucleotidyltransferase domain-containing protein [Nonomuraea sp. NPDC050663]|uniref:nucleotidyltransferase domain-containing protein n=1 Tax=Nonomuraea sp. NPDC050663 TaxID=3364370 RepID=UPI00379006BF
MPRIETPWGPWEAAPLDDVVALFRNLPAPWWIAGGYAVELAVGRPYREHGDVDIALLRRDHLAARALLAGWDVHAADPPGSLRPWPEGETLPQHVHDIWVREDPQGPWRFQLMLDEAEGEEWVFRRDPRIRRPLDGLTLEEEPGVRRLSPEVQLLYKSRGLRPKDELDFAQALPHLTGEQRAWLAHALELLGQADHPWREAMAAAARCRE